MMMGFEIVILLIIVGAVLVAMNRRSLDGLFRPGQAGTAKDILDARLARGDISVEEYRKLVEALERR